MTIPSDKLALASMFGHDRPPQELIEHVPHARHLGMSIVRLEPRTAVLRLPYSEELIGDTHHGRVFGGAITTLLDQCAGLAVFCSLEEFTTIATLDLRIDYLRAAEPGCDLNGRAECYRMTRNVAFVRGCAWDRDPEDTFASCLATFMIGANPTQTPLARLLAEADLGGASEEEEPQ